MEDDRRKFLKTVGGVSAALAGGPGLVGQAAAALPRPTGPTAFALEIDQVGDGLLRSFVGGEAFGEVVHEQAALGGIVKKHLANVGYGEIELAVGHELAGGLYSWIQAALDRKAELHDGALLTLDTKLSVAARREFVEALISEVAFPALDTGSKDAAFISVKLAPELTRVAKPQGKVSGPGKKAKGWTAANFRLKIDNLDATRVTKIDAFVVKQQFQESELGESRDYEKIPLTLEVGDLVVTMPPLASESFADWFDSFVVKGNNSDGDEKNGSLEFLGTDLKTVLFRLDFGGLGIHQLTTLAAEGEKSAVVQARMYCEQVAFSF